MANTLRKWIILNDISGPLAGLGTTLLPILLTHDMKIAISLGAPYMTKALTYLIEKLVRVEPVAIITDVHISSFLDFAWRMRDDKKIPFPPWSAISSRAEKSQTERFKFTTHGGNIIICVVVTQVVSFSMSVKSTQAFIYGDKKLIGKEYEDWIQVADKCYIDIWKEFGTNAEALSCRPIFNDIWVDTEVYATVKKMCDRFITNAATLSKFGVTPSFRLLLSGPLGTGKTMLAMAIVLYLKRTPFLIRAQNRINLDRIFIEDKHGIVIDDIDLLLLSDSSHEDVDKSRRKALMTLLDGLTTKSPVIIMTTNHPEVLDPALLRPGRVDLHLKINDLPIDNVRALLREFFPSEKETIDNMPLTSMNISKLLHEIIIPNIDNFTNCVAQLEIRH